MFYPKMILFDYGHTLCSEVGFDFLRGETALSQYLTANPRHLSPAEINAFAKQLSDDAETSRQSGIEMHEYQLLRMKNEFLGLQYSLSLEEEEKILWDNTAPGEPMPGTAAMLDELSARGIRTGVISNIGWSGRALTERLTRLLPKNRFEFVIASSEYALRKPSPLLFELALRKAGLTADEVWFCGDNPRADVEGAAGAGLFPRLVR